MFLHLVCLRTGGSGTSGAGVVGTLSSSVRGLFSAGAPRRRSLSCHEAPGRACDHGAMRNPARPSGSRATNPQRLPLAPVRNETDLSRADKAKLEALFVVAPDLGILHRLKEDFRTLFETATDLSKAAPGLEAWIAAVEKSDLSALLSFVALVRVQACAYFVPVRS